LATLLFFALSPWAASAVAQNYYVAFQPATGASSLTNIAPHCVTIDRSSTSIPFVYNLLFPVNPVPLTQNPTGWLPFTISYPSAGPSFASSSLDSNGTLTTSAILADYPLGADYTNVTVTETEVIDLNTGLYMQTIGVTAMDSFDTCTQTPYVNEI